MISGCHEKHVMKNICILPTYFDVSIYTVSDFYVTDHETDTLIL